MALEVTTTRQNGSVVYWLIGGVLVLLLIASCWYTYRWYMYGDDLPVKLPVFVMADPEVDESEVTETLVDTHTVPAAQPRYISIPSLGIGSTRVFAMGVDKKTNMLQSPANISDAAWYDQSDMPGSGGVVLLNGHNGGITRDGVFAKLGTLQTGDLIEIERGDGQTFQYEVRENQSMSLDDANSTGMQTMLRSAQPGREALNIITCDGKYVPRLGLFDRRIMLRALLVDG